MKLNRKMVWNHIRRPFVRSLEVEFADSLVLAKKTRQNYQDAKLRKVAAYASKMLFGPAME